MARWRETEPDQTGRPKVPATALVLGGVFGLEGGAAIAATIIPTAGIAGTVMLRLGLGSAGLLGSGRPSLRSLDRRAALLVLAVGSLLAAHHLLFYTAIHRLPLGVAVTLEFVGPLTVALAGSRRRVSLFWALLAQRGGGCGGHRGRRKPWPDRHHVRARRLLGRLHRRVPAPVGVPGAS